MSDPKPKKPRKPRAKPRLHPDGAGPNAVILPSTTPGPGGGRPSSYNPDIATAICERIALGETLASINDDPTMPSSSTIMRWVFSIPEFQEQYRLARDIQAELQVDEIIDIADDGRNDWVEKRRANGDTFIVPDREHISRSALRIESRKWIASHRLPKRYGNRFSAEVSGPDGGPIETETRTIDPRSMPPEAREALRQALRAMLVRNTAETIEPEEET